MTDHMTILSVLKKKFEDLKDSGGETLLKSVTILMQPVTAKSVFDFCPDMTGFPALILFPRETLPDNSGLTGTLMLELLLIAESYHPGRERDKLLRLQRIILDALTPDAAGKVPEAGGAHLLFLSARAETFGDAFSGWRISLKACYA